MKNLSVTTVIAAVAGTLAIGYYILCGVLYSFTLSGLWIWLGFGLIMYFGCFCKLCLEPHLKERRTASVYKTVKTVCLTAFAVFMAVFAVFECCVIARWIKGCGNTDTSADAVIILGATVEGDRPGDALQARIDTAYEYISKNPHATVITCGGLGEDDSVTEADCIKNELVNMGIPEDVILTESDSTSTYENFLFAAKHLPDGAKKIAVITSGFHQFRAGLTGRPILCETEDIALIPVSAADISFALPHSMIREFAAFTKDLLNGNIVL